MFLTEYNEQKVMAGIREDAYEEGIVEGETRGILSTLAGLVKDGILTIADAAKRANMTEDEFKTKTANI